jgi:hypothetical protein
MHQCNSPLGEMPQHSIWPCWLIMACMPTVLLVFESLKLASCKPRSNPSKTVDAVLGCGNQN